MRTTIAKQFRFEAGHRLSEGYQGKCAGTHGHGYLVEIELTAPNLDRFGMIVDFNNLKPVKDWIDTNLDHAMLLSPQDPDVALFRTLGPIYLTAGNPTAENIAALILDQSRRILGGVVVAVTVWETASSWARVTINNGGPND
jgi:6-pyruvoyltetrahydropterin/6-carboxytetrahydropterin synthase